MPVIVRNLDRDAAIIILVDSNIQRENILPSEKAKAYKMKLEAIKRQGARHDLTSRQLVGKSEAADKVGETTGESGRQIQRYIRLTELQPELQRMVDDGKIGMTPAVEALGYGLTDKGLHNSIISVIDFFADGEVYPVGRMERSGER